MFNVATAEGRAWLQATVEFLAARYGGPAGNVWGFIAGNEVNSHWLWANMGRAPPEAVVDAYEQAVRLIHSAVRKHSQSARVYLSLEHNWAVRYPGVNEDQACPGRLFLERFAQAARKREDFDWHIAYHPYPEPLSECRFWRDHENSRHELDSPVVSFRNLEVLTNFLDTEPMQYQQRTRRVILSEQGFHCAERDDGERDQAAAFALAYHVVDRLPGIDAFILHRHVDHAQEGGLRLGLWANQPGSVCAPDRKRLIYRVFQAAGTAEQEEAFRFALGAIGVKTWNEASALLAD
jgi:hypothetical protein